MIFIGPFSQIITLDNIPLKGAVKDTSLEILKNYGVVVSNGHIEDILPFERGRYLYKNMLHLTEDFVLLPGFIDAHTHICFAGSRAKDYSLRISGSSYSEILKSGGGIYDTVRSTREATEEELFETLKMRLWRHIQEGVTTTEVKTGYGLDFTNEIKQLRTIQKCQTLFDIVPTCLATHVCPKEFLDTDSYIDFILEKLLPEIKKQNLSQRVDIFIEPEAFPLKQAERYLNRCKDMGFFLTVHADQFSTGGGVLAAQLGAVSCDHLENTSEMDIKIIAKSNTVAIVLPGASLGLGMPFASARKFLDNGACLAIATDWNPGSAPMGDLCMQASVLAANQKLSNAEVFAGITFRAANAIQIQNKGILKKNYIADMIAFPTDDYREILYQQGKLKPKLVWKKGEIINGKGNI
ncbi:MAG: imidazolonepropionase [Chitinophagaceae bacterium]|nr:imidazolonepropionase [Chitinophagaceae bacterium]